MIIGLAVALLWVIQRLEVIVVPVALAMMLTALLLPAVDWLDRRGAPRGGAVALVLLSGFAIVGGILTFVVSQFITGLPGLVEQVTQSIDTARTWLIEGPAHLSKDQINNAGNSAIEALRNNQEKLTSGALSTAATVTEIVTGALLVLFTLIFFLHGGRNIWQFVTKIFPEHVRERVRDAGRAGFHSLIGYVRATFLVALVDAVGIGTGLAIMGVPLALPLASLVFLGAFIPLVGAVIAGFLAVVVALHRQGLRLRADHARADHRRAATRGPRAAAAGDGPRGVDPSAGGGAGHRGGRRAGRHRRGAAGGADGRVPQQRGPGAARQRTRGRTRGSGVRRGQGHPGRARRRRTREEATD